MTVLKVCQALLSLLSIQGLTKKQESNSVILLLLLYTLINFAFSFDLGLTTKIGNRFQEERSTKTNLVDDLILLFRIFLGSFYRYLTLAILQAIILVVIVHRKEVTGSNNSKLLTYFMFGLIVVVSYICGNVNKFLIILERQNTLAFLSILGLAIQNSLLYSVLLGSNFLLMAFSLVIPVVFVSCCILVGSYFITKPKRKYSKIKKVPLESDTHFSFPLGLSHILQYGSASAVPILLSSTLSEEKYFHFSILLKVFGFIGSVSGVFVQNNWQSDAFKISKKTHSKLKILRFSRRDALQQLLSFGLTLPLSFSIYYFWGLFTSVYSRPSFKEIGFWILASIMQVVASQVYFKLISIQAYWTSCLLVLIQSLTLAILCFCFKLYNFNYIYLIIGPLLSLLVTYICVRRIAFE
jgi:hypothetical protein